MIAVERIYADSRHNAFTSLVRWRDDLYLAFRSATRHVSPDQPDGQVRILCSRDAGRSWQEVALLAQPGLDMRDPKLLSTPERLYVHSFGYLNKDRRDAYVCYTSDGRHFTSFTRAAAEDNVVIWCTVQYAGRFYGAGYRYDGQKKGIRSVMYESADGLRWHITAVIHDVPWANETALSFAADGVATALVRNDGHRLSPPAANGHTVIATARPPYKEWSSRELDQVLQGFAWHRLPAGYLIAGRVHDPGGARTALFHCTAAGVLTRLATLPSGGDTAYPGLVQDGAHMLMSYYSSHETIPAAPGCSHPASIYLARFDLTELLLRAGVAQGHTPSV